MGTGQEPDEARDRQPRVRNPGRRGLLGYFGKAAGPRGKGWYSYNVGELARRRPQRQLRQGPLRKWSEQERWLRADLAAHRNQCTLAYWHQSRFSSDKPHGNYRASGPSGTRSTTTAPRLSSRATATSTSASLRRHHRGKADPDHGIRQFVVGTGGSSHDRLGPAEPNSQVRNGKTFGVLKLTLKRGAYDWKFLPHAGEGLPRLRPRHLPRPPVGSALFLTLSGGAARR